MTDPEVCVLGAGPAGTALAARLALLGHAVALVEREPVPRPRIGESLGPGIWPVLDVLGLREAVATAGFIRSAPARVRWRGRDVHALPTSDGLTVDRADFDAVLRGAARAAGAVVLAAARSGRPRRVDEGWEVPLQGRVLRCRFLADATGRRRLMGGPRTASSPRALALHAIWAGAAGRPQTCVDVAPEGWLWGAHLPGGAFRAMAYVDPEAAAAAADRERWYRRMVLRSPLFAELLGDALLVGPPRVCDATSYIGADLVDPTSVKVGEAAFAIDPLSSSGVQVAVQNALAAAAVVHTLRDRPQDTAAPRYYSDLVTHTAARHAATAAELYAEHETWAAATFWRRRGAGERRAAPAVPPPACLDDLLPRPARLVAGAALRQVPCLVGDRVETRRALTHPTLDRPVAFLSGIELAPLLDVLAAAPSLRDAVTAWDRVCGRGQEIAAWLARRGLLAAGVVHRDLDAVRGQRLHVS